MFARKSTAIAFTCAVLLVTLLGGGCARAKRDTTGFALSNAVTVQAGFEDTWQAVKHALRDQGLELYTRDKRGTLVAFTKEKNHLLQPQRVKYTINLSPVADKETQVEIEAVKQVYGVTLLTYPGWHDRKLTEDAGVQEILTAVQAKATAPGGVVEAQPATPNS